MEGGWGGGWGRAVSFRRCLEGVGQAYVDSCVGGRVGGWGVGQ